MHFDNNILVTGFQYFSHLRCVTHLYFLFNNEKSKEYCIQLFDLAESLMKDIQIAATTEYKLILFPFLSCLHYSHTSTEIGAYEDVIAKLVFGLGIERIRTTGVQFRTVPLTSNS
jgi:hypothetical protein